MSLIPHEQTSRACSVCRVVPGNEKPRWRDKRANGAFSWIDCAA